MNNGRKISSKYLLVLIFTVLSLSVTLNSPANYSSPVSFCKSLTATADTLKPLLQAIKDTLIKDSSKQVASIKDTSIKDTAFKDTLIEKVDTFDVKVSKDSLDAAITYSATDSIVMEVPTKIITLYNKANTKQKDLTLDAYKIVYDQSKQVVVATYGTDTSGKMIQRPKMLQADNTIESDSMVYSLKNQKGITKSSYTTSGEMFVYGEKIKKISAEEFYASRGRFTTCNLDTPHFAFRTNKMKLINKKFAITGPVHPEFEGVPLPIYIPFGFFPLTQGRHSGLLPPQFTASDQFGLGLTGLGYYRVINPNFDVTFRTDVYSYGGWSIYIDPEYLVRYRYRGRFDFTLQKTRILSTTGSQEFTDTKTYRLVWSHTVDSKARPGTTFSANVNLQSLKYNQFVLNSPTANFQNQLGSSISYSKTWNGKYNLTASANHSQNSNNGLISLTLPNLGFTATTIYPFQKKEVIGTPKWYEKLGVGLTTSFNNQANIYDSLFSFKKLIDTFQWGAHHSLPITLALPQLGPLQISPGITFQQNWFQKRTRLYWGNSGKKDTVLSSIQKGFFTQSDMSFSLGISTAIFGTFNKFSKNSSILGIRHVIRPTFSISYKPDLAGKDYYTTQVDSAGLTQRLSYYRGNIVSPFAEGRFGGISFGFDNTLEMKVRSKKDTSDSGIKKVKLIDGFGFSGSYNYLADSNRLSPISIYFRSTLFEKINITASTTLNPYVKDSLGRIIKDYYAWQQKGKFSLGTIDQGTLAISTSFKSKPKDKKLDDEKKKQDDSQIPLTADEQIAQMNYIATHAAEFADFNIDWSINLSFSLNFQRSLKPDLTGYQTVINSGLNWSGDFNLTPKWKINMSSYYDVKLAKINSISMGISRDMHCWQMSINTTPIGPIRSFNITISPKAGILRDLKVNRSRYFYAQ